MANILISPGKYVQGANEMARLCDYAKVYGKKALILITESGYKRIGNIVDGSFAGQDFEIVYNYFNAYASIIITYRKYIPARTVKSTTEFFFVRRVATSLATAMRSILYI